MSFLKWVVTGLLVGAVVMALVLAASQSKLPQVTFEYGVTRTYHGVFAPWPYPNIVEGTTGTRRWLVGAGKHGINMEARHGEEISLQGSRIARGPVEMLEVVPGSLRIPGRQATQMLRGWTDTGDAVLNGEIVDAKCWLGVMNPGEGKVHRDCAVRCISGGVPPALRVHSADGGTRILMLVNEDGGKLGREVLSYVGEPVVVSGRVEQSGGSYVLEVTSIRRYK